MLTVWGVWERCWAFYTLNTDALRFFRNSGRFSGWLSLTDLHDLHMISTAYTDGDDLNEISWVDSNMWGWVCLTLVLLKSVG